MEPSKNWEEGPGSVHAPRAALEVVQQAQDALLLALPELRAPAVPDVLRVLWRDKHRCRLGVNLRRRVHPAGALHSFP